MRETNGVEGQTRGFIKWTPQGRGKESISSWLNRLYEGISKLWLFRRQEKEKHEPKETEKGAGKTVEASQIPGDQHHQDLVLDWGEGHPWSVSPPLPSQILMREFIATKKNRRCKPLVDICLEARIPLWAFGVTSRPPRHTDTSRNNPDYY